VKEKLYFIGIGGTGMSSVAGLMQELGHHIVGSESGLYEPTKSLLRSFRIKVNIPYDDNNILNHPADLYVIANSLSRGNVELESVLAKKLNYTSFPELLKNKVLKHKDPLVVCGTHGKTTTTSLLSYCLEELNESPGYLIGGYCKNLKKSFCVGKKLFVIEGDEYDTAFFDKNPKLFHYLPQYLILNNIEFDHADIYNNIEEIEQVFTTTVENIKDKSKIIANSEDPRVFSLLKKLKIEEKVRTTSITQNSFVKIISSQPQTKLLWQTIFSTPLGNLEINTSLWGIHNSKNIAQVIATILALQEDKKIKTVTLEQLKQIIEKFSGISKRLEKIGYLNQAPIYFDFAHHPSAVTTTLATIRSLFPHKNIIAAFEPKNATSRRNIFTSKYQQAFSSADKVLLGPCIKDPRIPEKQQMDTDKLAQLIGNKAHAFSSFVDLQTWLQTNTAQDDLIIFMSPGDFANIPKQLSNCDKNSKTTKIT
jgi:UDP-N-acetylmuramate: L-alanyl-gamma-D-glutamyl-meso-diaminopimelate ligase